MKKKSLYFKDHPYNLYQSAENAPFPLPTNSNGFIGKKEYDPEKKPNTKRILFLGSSPIERLPPKYENKKNDPNLTVTHILERRLNYLAKKQKYKQNFEVLNLSSSAYTSYECLISYICKGRFFNPDLVISYQGVNDVIWAVLASGFKNDYSHARQNNFNNKFSFINDLFCALPDSKLINFLEKVFVKFKFKKPNGLIFAIAKSNLKLDPIFNKEKLDIFYDNLYMLDTLSKINGSTLLNLSLVWDKERPINPSHVYEELNLKRNKNIFGKLYNQYLEEINKNIVNNNKLKSLNLPQEKFLSSTFSDGIHFNLKGMRKFSNLLADYLLKNKEIFLPNKY